MRNFKFTLIFSLILILLGNFFLGCKKEPKVIKIGAILPLTGKAAKYGQYIKQGLELALEEINSEGGINGRKLEIIYEDDQADPKQAASAMSKLAEINKVPIVFGSWASSCVLAQAPIAERTKTVIMAEAISPQIRDAGDYVFRIQPDARYYLKQLVPFVFDTLKIKKIAILYINNDFGVDQAKVFKETFENLGGKIVYESGFPPGTSDFRGEINKIKNLSPEGIFIPAYTEIAVFLKQAQEAGLKSQFIASVPFENPEIVALAKEAAEKVIYPYHYGSEGTNELDIKFRKKYIEKYGYEPDGFAALAYDGLKIIAHVLKKVGPNSERIKNELYKVKEFPGVTGPTTFDDHGDVIKPIVIKTVVNGKFINFNLVRNKFIGKQFIK
jgi:branched-chain amino acid transport system substrate-binding protein